MTIEIDRSRILAYQNCPRSRWLGYHACGKGLQRKAKALPLQVGSAFHAGAECLLEGDIETACYRAIKYLADAFQGKGVGFDGEEVSDQALAYSAQEQVALAEGLIRAWGLERLPEFLSNFEVIEVEKEGRAQLAKGDGWCIDCGHADVHHTATCCRLCADTPNQCAGFKEAGSMILMFRPDALVREKLSGDYYVISWKTCSTYTKRTSQQARCDMQSMSEVFGVEESHADAE